MAEWYLLRIVKESVDGLQQGLNGQLVPVQDQTVAILGHPVGVARLIKGERQGKDWHTVVLGLLQSQVATVRDEESCPVVS